MGKTEFQTYWNHKLSSRAKWRYPSAVGEFRKKVWSGNKHQSNTGEVRREQQGLSAGEM